MTEIKFNILPDGGIVSLEEFELVIAGFTGKDVEKSKEHLRELEAQGIQTPSKIPVFYRAPMALATQNHWISVSNQMTSGEIEPVLVLSKGEYYISAGSDHTDRNMEKEDIARSKVACSKPLSSQAIPLKLAIEEWENSELSSEVKSGSEWVLYQSGKTVDIRDPMEIFAHFSMAECLSSISSQFSGIMKTLFPFVPHFVLKTIPFFSSELKLYNSEIVPIIPEK